MNIFKKIKYNRGMTLIELMVVLFIFMIVTGLTIFDYGSFRTSSTMQNISDDIALSIRKAQSYAIGAYGTASTFTYSYGMHFSIARSGILNTRSGTYKSFVLFTDITGDKKYTYDGVTNPNVCGSPALTNECSELLSIVSADEISNIYINGNASTGTPIIPDSSVDIVFTRPNLNAIICYRKATSPNTCDPAPISNVSIEVSNGQSGINRKYKLISVWNTGQISSK